MRRHVPVRAAAPGHPASFPWLLGVRAPLLPAPAHPGNLAPSQAYVLTGGDSTKACVGSPGILPRWQAAWKLLPRHARPHPRF